LDKAVMLHHLRADDSPSEGEQYIETKSVVSAVYPNRNKHLQFCWRMIKK
jgi:hypothetical protein